MGYQPDKLEVVKVPEALLDTGLTFSDGKPVSAITLKALLFIFFSFAIHLLKMKLSTIVHFMVFLQMNMIQNNIIPTGNQNIIMTLSVRNIHLMLKKCLIPLVRVELTRAFQRPDP